MYLDRGTKPPTLKVTEADERFALEHPSEEVAARLRVQASALLGQLFRDSSANHWGYSLPIAMHTLDGSVNVPAAVKSGAKEAAEDGYLESFEMNEGKTDYPWVESRGTGVNII